MIKKIFKKVLTNKKYLSVFIVFFFAISIFFVSKKDDEKISYKESEVKADTIEIKILATGTVQPENRLEIKPPIPGRIEKVLIKEGDKVKKGQILAWMSSTERAALLDAARSKGLEELKKWQEIYPPTPILAPISGTIVLKNVEQGETFTSADSLMSMSDRLTVKTQVDETDISLIQTKQKAEIILDAYPNQKILATVDKIAFDATTINSVTTYIVDVLPESVPSFMRSGMTANVTFFINSKNEILTIPVNALKIKDGHSFVLKKINNEKVEKEITVGITDGKKIEVLSGLNAGDIVLSLELKLDKNNSVSPLNPSWKKGGSKK